ncbi:hypothetical protein Dsin_023117 [Dipteronia sinensis]|uniref:DUF1985 domain-containing protein n=1 Tax=Dipteronia sinensis TaxID=43782 RepID=A0AAE0A3R0_9ROSI|nr:hypothetical protein Dsin_023117 [Dipteronia sinensis]
MYGDQLLWNQKSNISISPANATVLFRKGHFGKYLDLVQPFKVHGMLIYNLLKREIILPKCQKADEIWFGLGKDQARFGREEFCLCSGLNMGTLPECFLEKKEVGEDYIWSRYFEDKRPTVELLKAIFKELTATDGDDALKMAYLLMVAQFFRTDEGRTSVLAWLWPLVEDEKAFAHFSWGTYIFDVTFSWLKNAAEKHVKKLRGKDRREEGREEEKE